MVFEDFRLVSASSRALSGKRFGVGGLCAWGCSSVGRAVALQAIGQEFEPPQLHQTRGLKRGTATLKLRTCSSVG